MPIKRAYLLNCYLLAKINFFMIFIGSPMTVDQNIMMRGILYPLQNFLYVTTLTLHFDHRSRPLIFRLSRSQPSPRAYFQLIMIHHSVICPISKAATAAMFALFSHTNTLSLPSQSPLASFLYATTDGTMTKNTSSISDIYTVGGLVTEKESSGSS